MSPLRLAPVLIFVAFPLLELALLIKAGETLGFWPTIAIILFSAALGMIVIRDERCLARHDESSGFAGTVIL